MRDRAVRGSLENLGRSGSASALLLGATATLISMACGSGADCSVATLRPPDVEGSGAFGWALAAENARVLVGSAHVATDAFAWDGAAYLFDPGSAELLRTFRNPEPADGANFGFGVSLSDGRALIGAPGQPLGERKNVGAAHLFDSRTGELLHSWREPEPGRGLEFGLSVALSGTHALVSSSTPFEDLRGAGAVFVYDTRSGELRHTLRAPLPGAIQSFGQAMRVAEGRAVIGAPLARDRDKDFAGAAFVVDLRGGFHQASLRNPEPELNGAFGASVALSAARIVVAAPGRADAPRSLSGAVHVFDATDLRWIYSLRPPDGASDGRVFGSSVALSAGRILVGAPDDWRDAATHAGRVYVFDGRLGTLLESLPDPAPQNGRGFGFSVGQSTDAVLVGAPQRAAGRHGVVELLRRPCSSLRVRDRSR